MEAIVVCDLGFGDGGKGSLVDYLASTREVGLVIKYTGGPQAAHNVVMSDGRQHTFSQFGSATLRGVPTWIGPDVLIDPFALALEAAHLAELGVARPFEFLTIHEDARVITPWQKLAGREREARRRDGHGSCGRGVGELMLDERDNLHPNLRACDVRRSDLTHFLSGHAAFQIERKQLKGDELTRDESYSPTAVADAYRDILSQVRLAGGLELETELQQIDTVVLEGSQGVLIDEDFGFNPYTTWATTTPRNAVSLLWAHGWPGRIVTLGVTRSYMVRHGPGPMPTEMTYDERSAFDIGDNHNQRGRWQGPMRYGFFDQTLLKYALRVCADGFTPITHLAITHMDQYIPDRMGKYMPPMLPSTMADSVANTQAMMQAKPLYVDFPGFQEALGVPLAITSYGPTAEEKMEPGFVGTR